MSDKDANTPLASDWDEEDFIPDGITSSDWLNWLKPKTAELLERGRLRGIEEAAVVIGRARDEFEQRHQDRDATVCRMLKGEVTALTKRPWGEFTTGRETIGVLQARLAAAEAQLLAAEERLAKVIAIADAATKLSLAWSFDLGRGKDVAASLHSRLEVLKDEREDGSSTHDRKAASGNDASNAQAPPQ